MKETKVQFSIAEMELMCNSEIILTKNKVMEKLKTILAAVQNEMFEEKEGHLKLSSNEIFSVPPKISKGENYLGLPYLILDYPRIFRHQDIFAIRSMFWWGNFFSTTLHLSGIYKLQYSNNIEDSFNTLSEEKYSIGVHTDPWLHHFSPENYTEIALLKKDQFREACQKANHLKIAKKIPIADDHPSEKLLANWKQLTQICFG